MIGIQVRRESLGKAFLVVAALLTIFPAAALAGGELANATVYSGGVDIQSRAEYSQAIVTLSGGDVVIRRVLEPGDDLSIELFDLEGELLPDGIYNWRLELVPDADTARALRIEATANDGVAPSAWVPETGTFAIVNGLVVSPDLAELGDTRQASGLDSSVAQSTLGSGFKRVEPAVDDDAAVGSRVGVEEEMRAAIAAQSATAGVPVGRQSFERSDAGALAMGGSIEPPLAPSTKNGLDGAAPPAPRSISPDGKDGRPRSEDELR